MDVAPAELTDDVLYQLGALEAFCRVAGSAVRYVKPHGALYNTCVVDEVQAGAVVRAVVEYDTALPVLGLPGSALLRAAAAAGLRAVPEGFVDRGYMPEGHLVPRSQPGALVTDEDAVVERAVRMAQHGEVVAVDGSVVAVPVRSLCVPGDTPGAASMARRVRGALTDAGLAPVPFVLGAAVAGRAPPLTGRWPPPVRAGMRTPRRRRLQETHVKRSLFLMAGVAVSSLAHPRGRSPVRGS